MPTLLRRRIHRTSSRSTTAGSVHKPSNRKLLFGRLLITTGFIAVTSSLLFLPLLWEWICGGDGSAPKDYNDDSRTYCFTAYYFYHAWNNLVLSFQSQPLTRSKNAIVYLTGPGHIYRAERTLCPSLLHSIASLAWYLPPDPFADTSIIIMMDQDIAHETKMEIIKVSPYPVHFQSNISMIHPEFESNRSLVGGGMDYKRMCAFWFYFFFQLPFLPDYVMRMDSDSCLTSPMHDNPFRVMRRHRLEYMWYATYPEQRSVTENLRQFTRLHPGHPQSVDHDHDADWLWADPDDELVAMRVFSTNIEWFYIPAFRRPDVVEWENEVMQNGGIYRHRWGDAPLRTILVTRFLNVSAVGRFCQFSYSHSI